jgi:DNA-binding transcriptional ArsR family regulator
VAPAGTLMVRREANHAASDPWLHSTMKDIPSIANIAAVIGDPARAAMLNALMGGRALTATELTRVACITKQTASAHLRRLLNARLVSMEPQGRHRYFRIAGEQVAALIENLMGVAFDIHQQTLRIGPREPALRKARVCYDHLAGEVGVSLYDRLQQRQAFVNGSAGSELSDIGRALFGSFGVDTAALLRQRRTFCRVCMDWSERRHHLAGAVGAALLERILELHWAVRDRKSRIVHLRPSGERELRQLFVARG